MNPIAVFILRGYLLLDTVFPTPMPPLPPPSAPVASMISTPSGIPKGASGVNIADELKGATKVILLKV